MSDSLKGTIEPVPPTEVLAVKSGVIKFGPANGSSIEPTVVIADIVGDKGTVVAEVLASSTGTIAWAVGDGTSVAAGAVVARIASQRFRFTASVPPENRYRLLSDPVASKMALLGGPPPFDCAYLGIVDGAPTPAEDSATTASNVEDTAGSSSANVSVACEVPRSQTVVSGLTGELVIVWAEHRDVLTLPRTAVLGTPPQGQVVKVVGERLRPVDVQLGLISASSIEITAGIDTQSTVLEMPTPVDFNGNG